MAVEKAPQDQGGYELPKAERIIQDALSLSRADREELLAALQMSLELGDGEPLSMEAWQAAWGAELKRRLDNLEAGRTRLYSHEEVMAELEACLRQA